MPYFSVDSVKLHYDDTGAGKEPLVLVHGAVGSGAQFDHLVPMLAERWRVITPDLRGMARSEHVADMPALAWTDDVMQLIDHLELGRFHICGTSLGARIAMRVALQRPESVSTLTLDAAIMRNEERGDRALGRLLSLDTMPDDYRKRMQLLHGSDWEDVVAFYRRTRSNPEMQNFYDLRELVGGIEAPMLICRGDQDDDSHPIDHSIHAYRAKPGSWLWLAPNTPFSAIRERPGQFVEIFAEFVEANSRSAS